MEVLYEPTPDSGIEAHVDLIFFHGTLGDHLSTWTHPDTLTHWPRDLLPKDFPQARILALTSPLCMEDVYDRWNVWVQTRTKGCSDHHWRCDRVIDMIAGFREKSGTSERPIVFLAHSLGGLMCLNLFSASHFRFRAVKDVLRYVQGFVFFGTPFMDRGDDRWGKMAEGLLKITGESTNRYLVPIPRRGIDHFPFWFNDEISSGSLFRNASFVYISESLPVDHPHVKDCIVDEDGAVPSFNFVEDIDIGTATCIEADHVSICKYASASSEGYVTVREELKTIISKARFEHPWDKLAEDPDWEPYIK